MSKFKLASLLGKPQDAPMELKYIDVGFLLPDEKNNFNTEDIEELKDNIELSGIQQPLKVVPVEDGLYRIIAGHRRFKACVALLEEGKERFKAIPCVVSESAGEAMDRIANIMTNLTARSITPHERMEAVAEYKAMLLKLKEDGHPLPGRIRDIIAEKTGISKSEVGRLEQLHKKLSPEMKERLKEGEMNESEALRVSSATPEDQPKLLEEIREKPPIKPGKSDEPRKSAMRAVARYIAGAMEAERAAAMQAGEEGKEEEHRLNQLAADDLESILLEYMEKAYRIYGKAEFQSYAKDGAE